MSRTDQEFKAEVLRRSEEYRRRKSARRRKLRSSALCIVLVLGGMYLVRPFFAMGGSSEPMENDMAKAPMAEAPMSAEGSYSTTCAPGAAADYSFTAEVEEAMECRKQPLMAMIDGTLYVDTGEISGEVRGCSLPDGTITSYVTEGAIPNEDDQSNFGVGYGYCFVEAGTVEIRIDGVWRVFAADESP